MIAEVYPLKRMPRRFNVFDYRIANGQSVQRGDLVEVPFRSRSVLGVVKVVKEKPPRGIRLKTITRTVEQAFVREDHLSFFEWLAFDLAQSVPSVLAYACPTPPKRTFSLQPPPVSQARLTVRASEYDSIVRSVNQLSTRHRSFIFMPDLRRFSAVLTGFLKDNPNKKTLVITPTVRDAELLHRHTPIDSFLFTSTQTNNERYLCWKSFETADTGCLIGGKQALLLACANVDHIFVVHSGHRTHKQFDRNPRFDARRIARLAAERFEADLFFLDAAPRVDELDMIVDYYPPGFRAAVDPILVDLDQERPSSKEFLVTATTLEYIEQTLRAGQRVLCIYNNLSQTEYGIQGLSQTLQSHFPNERIATFYGNETRVNDHTILLTTQAYVERIFDPFAPSFYGLVAFLNADAALYGQTFRSLESSLHAFEQWRAVANAVQAHYLVQTQDPDLFRSFLEKPLPILQSEQQTRIDYGQPPALSWFHVAFQDTEHRKVGVAMKELEKLIRSLVPETSFIGPREAESGTILEFGVPHKDRVRILKELMKLKDQYIIDTHAFSC